MITISYCCLRSVCTENAQDQKPAIVKQYDLLVSIAYPAYQETG